MAVCVTCLWILSLDLSFGLCQLMNKSSAEDYCKDKGGLALYTLFSNGLLDVNALLLLKNQETAWIYGYVKYTDFLSWEGCYSSLSSVGDSAAGNDGSISVCAEWCNNYTVKYFGLQNNLCYCLSTIALTASVKTKVSDSLCGDMANTHFVNSSNVNVFRIHDTILNKVVNQSEEILRQCITAERNHDQQILFKSKSCYEAIDSYMCNEGSFLKLNQSCLTTLTFSNGSDYCLKEITADWFHARRDCRQYNGNLVTHIEHSLIKSYMGVSKSYWTGLFRDFQPAASQSHPKENNVCLSVRKVNNTFLMEPDDCSAQKNAMCYNSIKPYHRTDVTESFTSTPTTNERNKHDNTPTTNDGKFTYEVSSFQTSKYLNLNTTIVICPYGGTNLKDNQVTEYVAIPVAVTFFFVLAVIIGCITYRRKRKTNHNHTSIRGKRNRKTKNLDDELKDIQRNEITDDYNLPDGLRPVQQLNENEYNETQKPTGQQLKYTNEYKRMQLLDGRTSKESPEYDRVPVTCKRQRLETNTYDRMNLTPATERQESTEYDEMHVSSPRFNAELNDYSTTRIISSKQSQETSDYQSVH